MAGPAEQGRTDGGIGGRGGAAADVKQPPLYQVVLLNDDYTPMEFVVDVLERFFAMDRADGNARDAGGAHRGKGVCGVFTYEIAETKVAQVTTYARHISIR